MAQSVAQLVRRNLLSRLVQRSAGLFVQPSLLMLFALLCGAVVLTLAPAPVRAETQNTELLKDPTRPANISAVDGKHGENGADHALVLQSILMGPKRQVAIINGQTVALHGKIGAYTLSHLTETEAVLHRVQAGKKTQSKLEAESDYAGGKQRITLKLFPDFEKKRFVKNNNE
ncbi:MAG: hypothetical protein K2X63_03370 [Burkholderiaceae bacterium]|nr:hypothetical protein [Burkholderiaceae bacterium]